MEPDKNGLACDAGGHTFCTFIASTRSPVWFGSVRFGGLFFERESRALTKGSKEGPPCGRRSCSQRVLDWARQARPRDGPPRGTTSALLHPTSDDASARTGTLLPTVHDRPQSMRPSWPGTPVSQCLCFSSNTSCLGFETCCGSCGRVNVSFLVPCARPSPDLYKDKS